jgi:ABC-type amino acid transport substrate-binding protein
MIKCILFLYILSSQIFAQGHKSLEFSQIVDTPDQEIGARILERVYAKLKIPVSFIKVRGKRALLQSSSGKSDGEVHRIHKIGEVYSTLIRVPTPINYIEPNVFSIRDYQIKTCSDLKDLKVGIVAGVKHAEMCTQGFKKLSVLKHSLELIRVLNERGVDAVVTARLNGEIQVEKLGYGKIITIDPPLSKMLLYHYVHKKHIHLIPQIDKIIKEMTESGELDILRKKSINDLKERARKY